MINKIKNILKENKIIIIILFVFVLSIYFLGIRPEQIRKECSMVVKDGTYQSVKQEYSEVVEKQKQEKLGEYIQCRNKNLASSDSVFDMNYITNFPRREFTQNQYNSMSLSDFNQMILGHLSPSLYVVYVYNEGAYIMDNPTYRNLEENKNKYPQCNFPQNFTDKNISGGGPYTTNATDAEYKSCLRQNGIEI